MARNTTIKYCSTNSGQKLERVTEMKRRAIEKASSDICNVGTDATVPDSFDDDTLKRLYGLR